jgi:hypothetical protein
LAQDLARHRNCPKKSLKVKEYYQLSMCIAVYVFNKSMLQTHKMVDLA